MFKYSPFPYKFSSKDSLKSGCFYRIPKICENGLENKLCQAFYRDNESKEGFHVCPYGFIVDFFSVESTHMIFSCLNIEKQADRKKLKRSIKNDYIPRLPLSEYKYIKSNFLKSLKTDLDALKFAEDKSQFEVQRVLLNNTIHEIRKLNNQIKGNSFKLNYSLQNLSKKYEHIEKLNLDIMSTTDLMSIRLNTYDLEVNPNLNLNTTPKEIPIYRSIEKIYKCLSIYSNKKSLSIKLKGNSYNPFLASDVIEIAFFIILDNAIKYSPNNRDINIIFKEVEDRLSLKFQSWGIRPNEDEIKKLTNRGYRSKKVSEDSNYKGCGIGLHLFKFICDSNNISYSIKLGDDNYYENSYRYSPFIVEMKFNNMIQRSEEE